MNVLTRRELVARYDELLGRSLGPEAVSRLARGEGFGPGVVVQSSSGSSGADVVRIPRSPQDIADIFTRTLVPYLSVFREPPLRIAMLGGVSHAEAALKFRLAATTFASFETHQLDELAAFDPQVVSCYPSIARELAANDSLSLPSLRAFKLGGEPLFDVDLRALARRFGDVAFFEQVGSTEMPAVALGRRVPGETRRLALQTKRFSFLFSRTDAWQPLVVRDDHPSVLFSFGGFYDTGDEVRVDGGDLLDIRRRDDASVAWHPLAERLLEAGAVNVQISPRERVVRVAAQVAEDEVAFAGTTLRVEQAELVRIRPSNKLPLVFARPPR